MLTIRKTWFRASFIPTIPTKSEYRVTDEDGMFVHLEIEVFNRLFPLAQLNEKYLKDMISDVEYNQER
ncbi:MAG: hypothetical protein AAGC47_06890 [Bacteroidota bacterium]